jgi:anti-sigma regulatory factor (Ser/Thr protein kinase)
MTHGGLEVLEGATRRPRSVSPDRVVSSVSETVRLALRPVPASAGIARRFVSSTLRGWGCDALVETAVLLVSEVVTNAVLHARSDLEVSVRLVDDEVRVEVTDGSPAEPQRRTAGQTATTGRGLALVEACARRWGVAERPGGKAVWFDLPA